MTITVIDELFGILNEETEHKRRCHSADDCYYSNILTLHNPEQTMTYHLRLAILQFGRKCERLLVELQH